MSFAFGSHTRHESYTRLILDVNVYNTHRPTFLTSSSSARVISILVLLIFLM